MARWRRDARQEQQQQQQQQQLEPPPDGSAANGDAHEASVDAAGAAAGAAWRDAGAAAAPSPWLLKPWSSSRSRGLLLVSELQAALASCGAAFGSAAILIPPAQRPRCSSPHALRLPAPPQLRP